MEEFNDKHTFEENNEIDNIINEADMIESIRDLKIKLANDNYDLIIEKGIDVSAMKHADIEFEQMVITLKQMLVIFEDLEEYEKCTRIQCILQST